jgi:hypothetical protein
MDEASDRLQRQWRAADMGRAGQDLRAAVIQVAAVAEVHRGDSATLRDLAGRERRIAAEAARMRQPAEQMLALSVNARLACAALGSEGAVFRAFTEQIAQVAAQAQRHLATLLSSLAALRHAVAAARAAEQGFALGPGQVIAGIPQRVGNALATVETASRQAAEAAEAVRTRSEAIGAAVVEVVRAMQIGDITRQRIEHVRHVADLVTGRDHAPAAPLGWTVAAAQLRDTADQLDAEARRITEQLHGLGTAAQALARDNDAAFGDLSGSYLALLRAEVGQTSGALTALHAAFSAAETGLAAVRAAAGGLGTQVAALHHIEIDIRLLGLNTSLRAGRLGTAGRSLGVIAQALRECGRQIAASATAVRGELDAILARADALGHAGRRDAAAGVRLVIDTMTAAVARLAEADQAMVAARGTLETQCGDLAGTLATALAAFRVGEHISAPLRQVAEAAVRWAAAANAAAVLPAGRATRTHLLDRIAAGYTMQRERTIQARVTGIDPTEPAPAEAMVLEDLLL